jgi:hypothetical protein
MSITIEHVPMTREHLWRGRPNGPPRCIILHSTAGNWPGDYEWLRNGGSTSSPVSCHYLISPPGDRVVQFVSDNDRAWHAGESSWVLDGVRRTGLNNWSIGIELSNLNRPDTPHSEDQFAAAVALTRILVDRYNIPRSQVIRHRDCSPGRKTDPIALDWPRFLDAVFAVEQPTLPDLTYTGTSRILAQPLGTSESAIRYLTSRARRNATEIVTLYEKIGNQAEMDWFLALGQANHETGNWTSALSQPSNRDGIMLNNPAGIGVTGQSTNRPTAGFVWDADRNAYRACISFYTLELAVRAHLGRMLSYATQPGKRTAVQQVLVEEALRWRPLPSHLIGSAPTIGQFGGKWAPSPDYGNAVARMAEAVRKF